jgi:steroid 5-alpha reductase family enzyme
VSGVPLLEADLQQRSAAYRDYIASTPRFVPGRPKRSIG